MGGKVHSMVVHLRRDRPDLTWGLRLVGGSDIDTPLIITRVNIGTPAQKELLRGDIITKIDDYDARDLRHEDAENLFRNAGTHIKLAIQRDASHVGSTSISNGSSRCASSLQHSPLPAPYIPVASTPYSVSPAALAAPVSTLPRTTFPPESPWGPSPAAGAPAYAAYSPRSPHSHAALMSPLGYREEWTDEGESIVNQPYRTTPLVLPGAKLKKENGPTESYLRHHPNPAMRAAPHHDHDVLMKQKVADTMLHRVAGEEASVKYAHKQFNSPIGLYSESNIADTIKRETNAVPMNGSLGRPVMSKSYKKTVLYDPNKSETYKALREESLGDAVHEVSGPAQTKVFSPASARMGPIKHPVPQQQQQQQKTNNTYVSTLSDETIHQSNSFKRLMYHVLGETEY